MVQFEEIRSKKNQRLATKELGIPRTSLQLLAEAPRLIECISDCQGVFIDSPENLAFLHRLVMAVRLVILSFANRSIRMICYFLELSGLDAFVAPSFGAQQKAAVAMEEKTLVFGQEERARLAPIMDLKKVTVCEDELSLPI